MLSRDAINRVTLAAQSPRQLWRTRPLADTPPIVIVDRVWLQVVAPTGQTFLDCSGHERREMRGQERVVLSVIGVYSDRRHEILHYQAVAAEDTQAWTTVLAALLRRGLDRASVRMVVIPSLPTPQRALGARRATSARLRPSAGCSAPPGQRDLRRARETRGQPAARRAYRGDRRS
jgi:Transposase, Mutator family